MRDLLLFILSGKFIFPLSYFSAFQMNCFFLFFRKSVSFMNEITFEKFISLFPILNHTSEGRSGSYTTFAKIVNIGVYHTFLTDISEIIIFCFALSSALLLDLVGMDPASMRPILQKQ